MKRVFLSYSSQDNMVALRLYDDLLHSGLHPWRFEADSRIGVAFQQEFLDELTNSDVICLLDSQAARQSPYVRQECEAWLRLGSESKPRLLICAIERRGRPDDPGWWNVEIFEGQNRLTFIDLCGYDEGIRVLFRELEATYAPRFELPRDRELQGELLAAKLGPRITQELIDAYAGFRWRYAADPQTARGYLLVTIGRCRELGAEDVVSPRLASAVMAADSGDHRMAMQIFSEITMSHPADSRAWMGLGGALYCLEEFGAALEAFERCRDLTSKPVDDVERLREMELIHNTVRCLAVLGRIREATERLLAAPADARHDPMLLALHGFLTLVQRRPAQAREALEQAVNRSGDKVRLPWILDLADCYRQLDLRVKERALLERALQQRDWLSEPSLHRRAAEMFDRHGDSTRAVAALRQAASLEVPDFSCRVELASYLWQIGEHSQAREEAERALDQDLTPAQRYYRGLALFLLDRQTEARREEGRSRRESDVVRDWPAYERVLSG